MPKAFGLPMRPTPATKPKLGKLRKQGGKEMKFDVTKLTYGEIEEVFTNTRGTPFYVSKLGSNIIIGVDALAV